MATNETSSQPIGAAAAKAIPTPLTKLTRKQREEVTSELMRIHNLLTVQADKEVHKDLGSNKADSPTIKD